MLRCFQSCLKEQSCHSGTAAEPDCYGSQQDKHRAALYGNVLVEGDEYCQQMCLFTLSRGTETFQRLIAKNAYKKVTVYPRCLVCPLAFVACSTEWVKKEG